MRRPSVIAFTCAVAASLIVWASPMASAATWTAGPVTFTDSTTGTAMSCTASTTDIVPNSGASNPVAELTSISFTGCDVASLAVTLKPAGLSWPVDAGVSGRTIGEKSGGHGISVSLTSSGCSADIDGTGAGTKTGVADFRYTHKTGKLGIEITNGNLHIYGVSGCSGLISSGDGVSFTVIYTLK